MGSRHCSLLSHTSCTITMLSVVLLACVLAVVVEGSYYGYDGYGGHGGYGGYGGYGYGGYGYPSYGGYGGYGYGGYGYGYGSKYHKRSTDHQQVHVSGYAGQPTV